MIFSLAREWCTIQSTCKLKMNRDSKRRTCVKKARSSDLVPVTLLRTQQELTWLLSKNVKIGWRYQRCPANASQKSSTAASIFWPMTGFKVDLLRSRQHLTWSRRPKPGTQSVQWLRRITIWMRISLLEEKTTSIWISRIVTLREDPEDWTPILPELVQKPPLLWPQRKLSQNLQRQLSRHPKAQSLKLSQICPQDHQMLQ